MDTEVYYDELMPDYRALYDLIDSLSVDLVIRTEEFISITSTRGNTIRIPLPPVAE